MPDHDQPMDDRAYGRHEDLIAALVGPHRRLYYGSPMFKSAITSLAHMLPAMIQGMADQCEAADRPFQEEMLRYKEQLRQVSAAEEPDQGDQGDQEGVDPDRLYYLLSLVSEDFPGPFPSRDWIASQWSQETRRQVQDWAAAMHLSASDNDDVVIPPMPEVLKR